MAEGQSPFSPLSPFKDTRQMRIKDGECPVPVTRVCLVGSLADDERLIRTAANLNLPVESSENGDDWSFTKDTLFIVEDFDTLHLYFQNYHKILGPVAFIQIQEKFGKIPLKLSQPLYTLTLYRKKICLYGFEKTIMTQLKNYINFMGGSVRPSVKEDISYLVTKTVGNELYEKAIEFGIPALQDKWVYELWSKRHDIDCSVDDESLSKFVISELTNLKIAVWGYEDNEKTELECIIQELGASNVEPTDPNCTHLVVNDDENTSMQLPTVGTNCRIVIPEWLVLCVRMKVPPCEKNYLFNDKTETPKIGKSILFNTLKRKHEISPPVELSPIKSTPKSSQTPDSKKSRAPRIFNIKFSKCFSRKSLLPPTATADNFCLTPLGTAKENKADTSNSLSETDGSNQAQVENIPPEKLEKLRIRRHYKCEELCQTEKNYVDILNTINNVFKEPLEKCVKEKKPILNERDIKIIFHRFTPILDVHRKILASLEPIIGKWDDNAQVGGIFVKHSDEIIKVYPQFINHLDMIRDVIEEKSHNSCEFLKFLKEAELNPLCKRQNLKDLIAWPMQRIGRMILLLQGILEDTPASHPDHKLLQKAIQLMIDCGKQVNEDKRVTEHAIKRLEMFHEIENCPLEILSSKRYFVEKVFVQEIVVKDGNLRRIETVMCFFLFKEVLEVCKQRNNYFKMGQTQQKPYKHVAIYPLDIIQHVISVTDQKNKFAIVFQPSNEPAWRAIYGILGENIQVDDIVLNFARLVARCKMGNINEIHRKMSFEEVINYFSHTAFVAPPTPNKFFAEIIQTANNLAMVPKKENEAVAEATLPPAGPDSPEKFQFASPMKKNGSAKGKLRRAWSTLSSLVGTGNNLQNQRNLGSTTSVNVMMTSPQEPIPPTYTPPVGRRKLKSNSFQTFLK